MRPLLVSLTLLVLAGPGPASAQTPADEHASHHPGGTPATAASPVGTASPMASTGGGTAAMPSATAAMGGMAQMMSAMMAPAPAVAAGAKSAGCCGGPGQKPFYPSLMDMPALSEEARRAIRVAAIARLGSGGEAISAGQNALHHAQSNNDLAAAQRAVGDVREGLSLAASGTSALQALNESQPPPRIALTWFQRETGVDANGAQIMTTDNGELSWFHILVMLLLAAALVAAFLMRRARVRRIDALADRLTPGAAAAAAGAGKPAAPLAGGTAATPPAKPAADAKAVAPAVESAAPATGAPPAAGAKPGAAVKSAVPAKPWKGVLRIKAIFDETPTVKTFRLMEAANGPMPFTFLPGQYASIVSEIDGQKVRRSYTISSSPTQRDYIELTIKREQYGLESRHMHDHAQTGDLLEMSAPAGKFFFTGAEAKGIVLIAGGVGITPMMSVLRYLTDDSYPHNIHLIHAVGSPADLIFREEIEYLTRRHPNVHVAVIVSKADGRSWKGPVGRLTPEFIAECVPDIEQQRVHLCGPPPMMDAVKYALTQLKVPPDQVKTEDFAPPKGGPVTDKDAEDAPPQNAPPADGPDAKAPDAAPAAAATTNPAAAVASLPAEPAATDPAAAPSAQASIKFTKSGKTGQLAPDQPVLEAAEAIGVVIDFECRVGICGRCKVPLTEGTVTMEVEDALSAEEKAAGTILACQAKSIGNLVVDA